jgi:hypothetical protein
VDLDCLNGQMAKNMRVISLIVNTTEKEPWLYQMVLLLKAIGRKEENKAYSNRKIVEVRLSL